VDGISHQRLRGYQGTYWGKYGGGGGDVGYGGGWGGFGTSLTDGREITSNSGPLGSNPDPALNELKKVAKRYNSTTGRVRAADPRGKRSFQLRGT